MLIVGGGGWKCICEEMYFDYLISGIFVTGRCIQGCYDSGRRVGERAKNKLREAG